MHTVEDLLESLQRPSSQQAPSWRVRISFDDGAELEEMCEPDACWPAPLVKSPPARFIARQSINALRPHLREGGMASVRLEIEPPGGTVDDHGRSVRILIALLRLRGA
jgi:hypothetical protein